MAYAASTGIAIDRTKQEIEHLLTKHGASKFGYTTSPREAEILFTLHDRFIRYRLLMPDPKSAAFTMTPNRRWTRSNAEAEKAWSQAWRARWRALRLVIKAKLEAVEIGIATFEEEFLPYTVLPSGRTVAEHALPIVADAYQHGALRSGLLELPAPTGEPLTPGA